MPRKTSPTPAKPAAKKPKTPRANVGKTTAVTEDRRNIVLKMLREGHTCPAIGAALDISRERAWQLAKEALEQLKAETLDAAAHWRLLLTASNQASRLELDGVKAKAAKAGDLGLVVTVIDKQRALDNDLAKLWGAHAPTTVKTELTGKNGGPVVSVNATAAVSAEALKNLPDDQLAALESILRTIETPAEGA